MTATSWQLGERAWLASQLMNDMTSTSWQLGERAWLASQLMNDHDRDKLAAWRMSGWQAN